MNRFKSLIFSLWLFLPLCLMGQNTQEASSDTGAIEKTTQAYVEAFNRHDAKALAAFLSEEADYINPVTGAVVTGRDEIAEELKSWMDSAKVGKVEVTTDKITFPEADTAIQTGVLKLTYQDNKSPKQKAFKAVFVKEQDKWLFDEIQQVDIEPEDDSHYVQLKELEWMLGSWEDVVEDVEMKSKTIWWDQYKNYMLQTLSSKIFNQNSLDAQQIIGWDPNTKQIRSWIFDTDGGFGSGKWYKKGQSWHVDTSYTLPDGRRGSAIHIYTKIDDNTHTWASEGRDLDGEILPNIAPIKIVKLDPWGQP